MPFFIAMAALLAAPELDPGTSVLAATSRSVVSVSCVGRNTATGFLWKEPRYVVTALHVVAACSNVFVRFEQTKQGKGAKLIRVLQDADLALLEIADPPELPVLQPALRVPRMSDPLVALGYGLGAPTMHSVDLKLSYGSSLLVEMLPQKAAGQVKAAGSPSLTLRVLRLQGHLMPGLSGAPIVDRRGNVVAIGDGGLESGAVGVSWGIPLEHLARLERSREDTNPAAGAARELFAAETEASPGESIRCGSIAFTKLRTARYKDLIKTTDDPLNARNLSEIARVTHMDPSDLEFDIYSHLQTGATFVAPAGLTFEHVDGDCVAMMDDEQLQMRVSGAWRTTPTTAARRFSDRALTTDYSWQLASASLSATQQRVRFDNLKVSRSFWFGRAAELPFSFAGETPAAHAVRVLLSRDDSFLGIAVLVTDPALLNTAMGAVCGFDEQAPGCPKLITLMRAYLELTLAAFLSTYPIG